MPIHQYIQTVAEEIPTIDADEILNDAGVVDTFGGGQDSEIIRRNIERQIELTEAFRCILCEREIHESVSQIAVVQTNGLSAVFCGGTCMLRFYSMQWLTEKYDEIIEDIRMISQVPITNDSEDEV